GVAGIDVFSFNKEKRADKGRNRRIGTVNILIEKLKCKHAGLHFVNPVREIAGSCTSIIVSTLSL
ncbi:MAG: hypothetical protein ACXWC7_05915, partial [Chitinophagaceae bacterium]